jgi:hypothetical protein
VDLLYTLRKFGVGLRLRLVVDRWYVGRGLFTTLIFDILLVSAANLSDGRVKLAVDWLLEIKA